MRPQGSRGTGPPSVADRRSARLGRQPVCSRTTGTLTPMSRLAVAAVRRPAGRLEERDAAPSSPDSAQVYAGAEAVLGERVGDRVQQPPVVALAGHVAAARAARTAPVGSRPQVVVGGGPGRGEPEQLGSSPARRPPRAPGACDVGGALIASSQRSVHCAERRRAGQLLEHRRRAPARRTTRASSRPAPGPARRRPTPAPPGRIRSGSPVVWAEARGSPGPASFRARDVARRARRRRRRQRRVHLQRRAHRALPVAGRYEPSAASSACAALGEHVVRHVQPQFPARDVDHDRVVLAHERDRAAAAASGETWPIDSPEVPPENRPSVISAQARPSPLPFRNDGRVQHLLHARPAARALVADHDDVAGRRPGRRGSRRRRPPATRTPGPGRRTSTAPRARPAVFTTAPSGARLPYSMREPAVGGVGVRDVADAAGGRVEVERLPARRLRERLGRSAPRRAPRGTARPPRRQRPTPTRRSQSAIGAPCTVCTVAVEQPGPVAARRGSRGCRRPGARPPRGRSRSARPCTGTAPAATARRCPSARSRRSASCAAASRCRIVLVEPPIAMSSAIAFSNASRVAIDRGSTDSSSSS